MKRLALTYRRPGDAVDRTALTPAGFVFLFGARTTPVTIAVSELLAVELVDDEEAGTPGRESLRTLHIGPGRESLRTLHIGESVPVPAHVHEEPLDAA